MVCLGYNSGLIKFIELDKKEELGDDKYRPAEITLKSSDPAKLCGIAAVCLVHEEKGDNFYGVITLENIFHLIKVNKFEAELVGDQPE